MMTIPKILTLSDLVVGLGGGGVPADSVPRVGATPIRQVVIDSRQATPGSLFVALRGRQLDGHDFVAHAFSRGAVATIAERAPQDAVCTPLLANELEVCQLGDSVCIVVPDSLVALQRAAAHWRRQHDVRVVGITGSVGKTTSKEFIASVLSQRYSTLRSESSYNNEIGLPLTLLHLTAAHERVVLEMGMYDVGEIAQLADIALPQVGVVTNIGPTHLERLGSIARIAQAKAELPEAVPPAEEGGVVILNEDDEWVRAMANQTRARVFTYGLGPSADLWADSIESEGLEGIRFRFHHGRETILARVPMLGRHSVHTALRAAAVGLVEGLSWEEIVVGLRDQSAQLRLLAVPGPVGSVILDDTYNASPASSMAALGLLDELDGRKIAVLGDMYELGSYEEEGHKLVGRRVRDVADLLITVGQLGRIMGEEALAVGMPTQAVHLTDTNGQAIDLLRGFIEDGTGDDRVLVKGSRGMQMEEIVSALAQSPRPAVLLTKEDQP
jgi:UDP-N-acetylmuramoyl-tripeptide--D-alanyl-D-alanine ligase